MSLHRLLSCSLWAASVTTTLFLFWVSSTFGHLSYEYESEPAYYEMLADAFLHGQLNLKEEPSENLLQSENPYDPWQRGTPQDYLWDASLYKGKYFLYFGAVPALLFFLPCKVLLGFYPTDNLVIALVSLATIGVLVATCQRVATKLLRSPPAGHLALWPLHCICLESCSPTWWSRVGSGGCKRFIFSGAGALLSPARYNRVGEERRGLHHVVDGACGVRCCRSGRLSSYSPYHGAGLCVYTNRRQALHNEHQTSSATCSSVRWTDCTRMRTSWLVQPRSLR
jgi:hypothetical protein